jgi:uncharacterized protein (DUF1697 family)
MQTYVALLRAVNVGGTGQLPMAELKSVCETAGFSRVETYIASGNVVFDSALPVVEIERRLESGLLALTGRPVGAFVRSVPQLRIGLAENPFADKEPQYSYVVFLREKPGPSVLADVRGRAEEELRLGRRELYVYYPGGMARSKLRIPAAQDGTARNMNTVSKLLALASRRLTSLPCLLAALALLALGPPRFSAAQPEPASSEPLVAVPDHIKPHLDPAHPLLPEFRGQWSHSEKNSAPGGLPSTHISDGSQCSAISPCSSMRNPSNHVM